MGRPLGFDADKVLTTVFALLSNESPDLLGMDKIIDQTSVPRQSLYRTWGSKAGLIAEAIERGCRSSELGLVTKVSALVLSSGLIADPKVSSAIKKCTARIHKEQPGMLEHTLGSVLLERNRRNR